MSTSEFPVSTNPHLPPTRRLVGFAMGYEPETVYRESGSPEYPLMPKQVGEFIADHYSTNDTTIARSSELLTFGIGEVSGIIRPILDRHPHFTFEQAVGIAQHADTIVASALTANRPNPKVAILLQDWDQHYSLNPDQTGIITTSRVDGNKKEYCPVVHFDGESIHSQPIFNRFHKWAAHIAVISYFDYK